MFCLVIRHVVAAVLLIYSAQGLASAAQEYPASAQSIFVPVTPDEYFIAFEQYYFDLIRLALDKSGGNYELVPVRMPPRTEARNISFLEQGKYDIHWLNTSRKIERKLLPVRIPLFKGLIGWKLLLIHSENLSAFKQVSSLGELKQFSMLHGASWADTPMFHQAGFTVLTSTEFRSMSRMLERKRADFFPRGITEIWSQLEAVESDKIVVEEKLALQFPAAYYFFVSRQNKALAASLEKGLEAAIADGSFDRIFWRYHGDAIRRAQLHERRVFHLDNPAMPEQTPLGRQELWFSTDELKKLDD